MIVNSVSSNNLVSFGKRKRNYPDTFVRKVARDQSAHIPCAYVGCDFAKGLTPSYEHIKPFSQGGVNGLENLLVVESKANSNRSNDPLSFYVNNTRQKNKIDPIKCMVKQLIAYDQLADKMKNMIKKMSVNVYNELKDPNQKTEFLNGNKFISEQDVVNVDINKVVNGS